MFSLQICEKVRKENGQIINIFHDVNENQRGIILNAPIEQQKIFGSEKTIEFTQNNPQKSARPAAYRDKDGPPNGTSGFLCSLATL